VQNIIESALKSPENFSPCNEWHIEDIFESGVKNMAQRSVLFLLSLLLPLLILMMVPATVFGAAGNLPEVVIGMPNQPVGETAPPPEPLLPGRKTHRR
jgi:hypothetical protein